MRLLPFSLDRSKLPRPRLLPMTIVAMFALFAVKSTMLVQAAAEESHTPASASGAPAQGKAASQPNSSPADPARGVQQGATPPATVQPPVTDAERAILLDLRRRRDTLEARARELDERDAELAAVDKRLSERVQQLGALQTRLESLEEARRQHGAENWSGLVKTYETMKPRDAATIFDSLDMQVLLQVLDRMQERRVAPVLAAMQPDRARLATQLLAEMRTRAVTVPATTTPSTLPSSPSNIKPN